MSYALTDRQREAIESWREEQRRTDWIIRGPQDAWKREPVYIPLIPAIRKGGR